MATIIVKATPSDDLRRYEVTVDDRDVDMRGDSGEIGVSGACGDGSTHTICYHLVGAAGSKLKLEVFCGETSLGSFEVTVRPEGEPDAAGCQDFSI